MGYCMHGWPSVSTTNLLAGLDFNSGNVSSSSSRSSRSCAFSFTAFLRGAGVDLTVALTASRGVRVVVGFAAVPVDVRVLVGLGAFVLALESGLFGGTGVGMIVDRLFSSPVVVLAGLAAVAEEVEAFIDDIRLETLLRPGLLVSSPSVEVTESKSEGARCSVLGLVAVEEWGRVGGLLIMPPPVVREARALVRRGAVALLVTGDLVVALARDDKEDDSGRVLAAPFSASSFAGVDARPAARFSMVSGCEKLACPQVQDGLSAGHSLSQTSRWCG